MSPVRGDPDTPCAGRSVRSPLWLRNDPSGTITEVLLHFRHIFGDQCTEKAKIGVEDLVKTGILWGSELFSLLRRKAGR